MILCSTSTTLFLSISVFLLVNFLTRSLEAMGLLIRYLLTSSSVMQLLDTSTFCFLAGGVPSGVADVLGNEGLVLAVWPASLSRFLECLLLFFFGEPIITVLKLIL